MAGPGRLALPAALLMLVPACKDEPTFEERYSAAEKKIRTRAGELDGALAEAERRRAAQAPATPGQPVGTDQVGTTAE